MYEKHILIVSRLQNIQYAKSYSTKTYIPGFLGKTLERYDYVISENVMPELF
jgi:hypothetical protein